jgi:hypothetical protein
MRSCLLSLSLILSVAIPMAAGTQSLQQMIERAQKAPVKDQPGLYMKIAERRLQDADRLYQAHQPAEASAAVSDIVTYCDHAYEAADRSDKKLKNTEISIRKIADKLQDIRRELDFENQAPVEAAVNHLEGLRTKLLTRMFGKEKK